MFNPFEELFAPGRKHTQDEQNRLELTREDVGDADPGHGPIDLSSGKVLVRAAEPEPAGEEPTGEEPPGEGPAGEGPDRAGPEPAEEEPSRESQEPSRESPEPDREEPPAEDG